MTMMEAFRITNADYSFEIALVIKCLLFVLFFLCWFMHRQNIFRMLVGKENKVNLRKSLAKLGKKKEKKSNKKEKEI